MQASYKREAHPLPASSRGLLGRVGHRIRFEVFAAELVDVRGGEGNRSDFGFRSDNR